MKDKSFDLTVRVAEAVIEKAARDIKELILMEARRVVFPTMIFGVMHEGEHVASPEQRPAVRLFLSSFEELPLEYVVLTPDGIFWSHWKNA